MSGSVERMEFKTLKPVEIEVVIADKSYTLRQATTAEFEEYRETMFGNVTMDAKGNPTKIKGFSSLDRLIVSLCLRDSNGKRVSYKELGEWRGDVVKDIAKRARQISGLAEEDEEEEQGLGNSQGNTEGGSG